MSSNKTFDRLVDDAVEKAARIRELGTRRAELKEEVTAVEAEILKLVGGGDPSSTPPPPPRKPVVSEVASERARRAAETRKKNARKNILTHPAAEKSTDKPKQQLIVLSPPAERTQFRIGSEELRAVLPRTDEAKRALSFAELRTKLVPEGCGLPNNQATKQLQHAIEHLRDKGELLQFPHPTRALFQLYALKPEPKAQPEPSKGPGSGRTVGSKNVLSRKDVLNVLPLDAGPASAMTLPEIRNRLMPLLKMRNPGIDSDRAGKSVANATQRLVVAGMLQRYPDPKKVGTWRYSLLPVPSLQQGMAAFTTRP